MKKIKQAYPRRSAMLATKFEPLSDDDFRKCVADGSAVPGGVGTGLFVAKWRDGPGMSADEFLAALSKQGSKLMIRRYKTDVNIRVVRSHH
jgi:hypothetical protein